MHKQLIFLLLITQLWATTASTANADTAITVGKLHTLSSEVLAEERDLLVYLPNGYDAQSKQSYPLLLVLDGRMNFKMTASTIHSLAEGGAIPRMIVVGVANTDRWRDLTPVPGFGIAGTGGGDDFVAFVKDELMPWIDQHYRLNGFKVISGHSLGGLTTLHLMNRAPELFDAYVSLSPSLEWGEGFMVNRHREQYGEQKPLDKMLYLAIADEQMERPYYDQLVSVLRENAPPGLAWNSELFENSDDHMSIRVSGALSAIRWVFNDWRLTSAQVYQRTDQQVNEHYANAANRFKQPRKWGLMDMTNAAYWGLYKPETAERAMHLFNLAVQRWPESAYAWSCLGEGLERTGKPNEALAIMRKALAMAKAAEHQDVPYFQGMVDRVAAHLAKSESATPVGGAQ